MVLYRDHKETNMSLDYMSGWFKSYHSGWTKITKMGSLLEFQEYIREKYWRERRTR